MVAMDNLTHTLVGVLLARAGLNRMARRATWLAVVAANLPDIDVLAGLGGTLPYIEAHRGWTHALAAAPLLAALALPLWWLAARPVGRGEWAKAYAMALVCVLSHLGLDALNGYGLRWGLPFSSAWLHLDVLAIFDLWLWALLGVCVLGPLLGRLVSGEMGARDSSGRGMAWAGLVLMVVYIGARTQLHGAALEALNSRVYQGEPARRVLALPSAAVPWRWTGLVETARAWRMVPVDLTRDYDPEAGRVYFQAEAAPARSVVARSRTGRAWLGFAVAPLWRTTPAPAAPGALEVTLTDLRFGAPGQAPFEARFTLSAEGRVLEERIGWGAERESTRNK
jgi:inner membrane protein